MLLRRQKQVILTLGVLFTFVGLILMNIFLIKQLNQKNKIISEKDSNITKLEKNVSDLIAESTKLKTQLEEKNNLISMEKFGNPLPEKYKYNITSRQGLRSNISVDSGGILTGYHWHNGYDIACPDKTPVYADKDGYITDCYPGYYNGKGWNGHKTFGGLLVITHEDGTISLYAHLSKTLVRNGDYVSKGQQIGLSGGVKGRRASGISTGPHLHYAIYLNMNDMF